MRSYHCDQQQQQNITKNQWDLINSVAFYQESKISFPQGNKLFSQNSSCVAEHLGNYVS